MPYLKTKACATRNYNKLFASRHLRYSTLPLDRPKYLSLFALLCRILDASRNHGSGSGDMYAYIPTSDFPRRRRAILSIYMRTLVTVTLANPDLKSALVSVAPIPEMDALFPIIGFFAVTFATQRLQRRQWAQQ